jgi:aminoglycoside phosphotransferase
MSEPAKRALEWAARLVAPRADVVDVERLRRGGCVWRLRIDSVGAISNVVLKCGSSADWREAYACEAAALEVAHEHHLPVPRLLGVDLEATGEDPVALLMTWVQGSSTVPRIASVERLLSLGRLAGMLQRIALEPSSNLPLRERHTAWTDFALWRRLSNRYRSVAEEEREAMLLEVMTKLPGWSRDAVEDLLRTTESAALLNEADKIAQAATPPLGPTVFVHGDFWHGNTMWDGDRCVGLLDWETAGVGQSGVDLGCLRWDSAILFGLWAPEQISIGWSEVSGCEPESQPYWDVISALNVPADAGKLLPSLHEAGRTDLDSHTLVDRHAAFLQDALDRLNRDSRRTVAG